MATLQAPRAPGPKGHWLYGSLLERRNDPLNFFRNNQQQFGDVVHYRMGPRKVILLAHPDHIKHVLVDRVQNYRKAMGFRRIAQLIGNGLLTSEGDFWKRQRRLAQPAFHKEKLAALAAMMVDATREMMDGWAPKAASGQPFDIAPEMMRLTATIVARALFTADVSGSTAQVRDALTVALEEANRRVLSLFPLPPLLPTARNRRYRAAISVLDEVVLGIINGRRQHPEQQGDLLAMLMNARDEETGEAMTDAQLRDEVMTLFLAGHETTANGLAWTWWLLGQHPEAERKLRAEVAQVLGGRPATAQEVPKLPYTSWVFEEAMRLYPPAWIFGREAVEPDTLGGFLIPKGALVLVSPYVMHRHPRYWENPDAFEPERFSPERSAQRPRFAYFPFGGGQRMCIGNNFAMMEATLILATMIQRYQVKPVEGTPPEAEPLITLRPKHGIPVTVAPAREGAQA